MRFTVIRCGLFGIIACVLSATIAYAQTASTILVVPWQSDETAQFYVNNWSQNSGEAKQSGQDVRLSRYVAVGRMQLDPGNPQQPVAGVLYHQLNTHSDDPVIPDRLIDVSAAGSMHFDLENDLDLQVTLGAGYAGDNAFGDGRAYYGIADVIVTQPIDETHGYKYILTYNGNRSIFPDLPLPGFVYYGVYEGAQYAVGFPASTVTVFPNEKTRLQATYIIPWNFNANARYELVDGWAAFASYDSRFNAYTLDDDPEHRRLMFSQQRVEAGLTWNGNVDNRLPGVTVTLAGGYAFDQEFSRGWDVRDDDTLRDISDEPFVRIGAMMRF